MIRIVVSEMSTGEQRELFSRECTNIDELLIAAADMAEQLVPSVRLRIENLEAEASCKHKEATELMEQARRLRALCPLGSSWTK